MRLGHDGVSRSHMLHLTLQTILTEDPTPAAAEWQKALEAYAAKHGGQQLLDALKAAYSSVGLCRETETGNQQT